jgi:hypothetical protein
MGLGLKFTSSSSFAFAPSPSPSFAFVPFMNTLSKHHFLNVFLIRLTSWGVKATIAMATA